MKKKGGPHLKTPVKLPIGIEDNQKTQTEAVALTIEKS